MEDKNNFSASQTQEEVNMTTENEMKAADLDVEQDKTSEHGSDKEIAESKSPKPSNPFR